MSIESSGTLFGTSPAFTISSLTPTASIPFPRPRLPARTVLGRSRPVLSLITDFEAGIPLKMRFQSPQLGALGVTFTALRALQFLSLVSVVGLTANFINEFASTDRQVPDVLVGTVTVVRIFTLFPLSPLPPRLSARLTRP